MTLPPHVPPRMGSLKFASNTSLLILNEPEKQSSHMRGSIGRPCEHFSRRTNSLLYVGSYSNIIYAPVYLSFGSKWADGFIG